MSNYGRHFEFRVAPISKHRSGRNFLDSATAVPIGAPVTYSTGGPLGEENGLGLRPMVLAAQAASAPAPGQGGIAVYEYGPAAFAGDDAQLVTYSDKMTVPAGAALQVVNGDYVKVVLRNVPAYTFNGTRSYAAINMIDPDEIDSLEPGDGLLPGPGSDAEGYWQVDANMGASPTSWLVVERVTSINFHGESGYEVEARLNF